MGDTLTIQMRDFIQSLKSEQLLSVLIELLLGDSRLNYDGDGLYFNDELINGFLKSQFTNQYKERLDELRAKEHKE